MRGEKFLTDLTGNLAEAEPGIYIRFIKEEYECGSPFIGPLKEITVSKYEQPCIDLVLVNPEDAKANDLEQYFSVPIESDDSYCFNGVSYKAFYVIDMTLRSQQYYNKTECNIHDKLKIIGLDDEKVNALMVNINNLAQTVGSLTLEEKKLLGKLHIGNMLRIFLNTFSNNCFETTIFNNHTKNRKITKVTT